MREQQQEQQITQGQRGEEREMLAGDGEEEEEDDGFEAMKTPFERSIEGRVKVRAVPVLTIWLSAGRVEALKRRYGEQSNGLEMPE